MHVDNLFGQHAATDNGKCYFNAFNAVFKNPDITPWNAFPFWTFNNLKINKHWGEKIVHWLRRTSFLNYHSKAFSVMKPYVCLDKICAELLSSISSVVSFFFHFFAVILVLPPFLISSHCLVPFFIVFYMLSPPPFQFCAGFVFMISSALPFSSLLNAFSKFYLVILLPFQCINIGVMLSSSWH